ncbi:MAG: rubredoxin-type Fe(Cys)4 protein [Proteobacteria bacterium]|nr:rubredoxin-type Fe(Cys)4 protein [Pseudomonadota bacterium]
MSSNWECGVCGYIHKAGEVPEKCPVCEAPGKMFKEIVVGAKQEGGSVAATSASVRRWRCSICGYIHSGNEPPDTCPVCAAPKNQFVEIDADGKKIGVESGLAIVVESVAGSEKTGKKGGSLFNTLGNLVLKLHLHPITVHFPNGIIPAVVAFLAIAGYFNIVGLELAAYYNLIFVLLMLPVVMLTGFIEWQKRYKGVKSMIFITKIFCSVVVLAATNILVFWRLIDPAVLALGSPSRLIYLGVAAGLLVAVGIAGHLGGKLVFGTRK